MNKVIYSLLVPKDIGEEKMQELAATYAVAEKSETDLEGFDLYKQVADEDVNLETKELAKLEDGVFAVVADKAEESEAPVVEKEVDYAKMDSIGDAAMAMLDVVFGTLRQPESSNAQRKNTVLMAVDNFRKYAEAVMVNAKAEDVVDISIKGLFEVEDPAPNEDELREQLLADIVTKEDEKRQAVVDEFTQKLEELKDTLNASLTEKFEAIPTKEEVETRIKGVEAELETLKNTPKSRQSERDEYIAPAPRPEVKKTGQQTFV